MWVYEFHTKANFYGGISWFSVWSYLSLWVSKKRGFWWRRLLTLSLELLKFTSFKKCEFLRRHFLSLSLKLWEFMSFKQKRILMKTFLEPQFQVMWVSEFQTKAKCDKGICLVSLWSFLRLWVWNQSKFSRRHLLSLSFKLCKFMTFKQKRILVKTFVESQFEII